MVIIIQYKDIYTKSPHHCENMPFDVKLHGGEHFLLLFIIGKSKNLKAVAAEMRRKR